MKETYENMDLFLKAVSYPKYGRKVCGDLKVIGLILGTQSDRTRFFAVWFVNGTAEQKANITKLRPDPCEISQCKGKSMSEINR